MMLLLLVLIPLLGSKRLLATATADNEAAETCLPDGTPLASRQDLLVDSTNMPLGVWYNGWASASLTTEVAMILIQEVLGINTVVSEIGTTSTAGLYAAAGCANPAMYADEEGRACSLESHARNPHHVVLETWGLGDISTMEARLAPIAEVIPEWAGPMGYVGQQGMYIFERERQAIYEEVGLALEYYKSWDYRWHEPWLYFDKMTDVNASLLRKCTDLRINDPLEMERYFLHTADEGGIVRDENGAVLTSQCWNGSWWVSPACRDDLSKCVPSITAFTGWGMEANMQRATLLNMPVAFASGLTGVEWGQLGRSTRGVHYWYTPDDTFVAQKPNQIIFPPFSAEEQMRGLRVSADVATPLSKFLWNRLEDIAPRVRQFVLNLEFSQDVLDSLLIDAATNRSDSFRTVACRWIRANRDHWQSWIPSNTQCVSGFGLVNESRAFVKSLADGAVGCEFCPAGRYSQELLEAEEETRTCELCAAGTRQEEPLQVECLPCAPGTFSSASGAEACEVCAEGFFQSLPGAEACQACPTPAVTRLLAATSVSQCVCPAGTYQLLGTGSTGSAASNLTCATCPEGMECALDSREEWLFTSPNPQANYPRLREGYMSKPSNPLTVYKCLRSSSCPGGRVGTCATQRDSETIACAECVSGAYEDTSGNCEGCEGWQSITMLVLSPFVVAAGLIALAWASNKERIAEANASTSCAIVAGLLVASIQTMSVMSNLEVTWYEPLKSCLTAFSLIGFDVKVIGLGCLIQGGTGMFIMRQLLAPLLAAALFVITAVKKVTYKRSLDFSIHLCNSVGSLFMLFFISIILSGVMPLICYKHPGNSGDSMVNSPSVLCFEGDRYFTMLAFGMASLGLVALPYFVVVLWATYSYPSFIANSQSGNGKNLRRFYFLFRRFEPHAYFYGSMLMARSLCICMVPVIFRDNGAAHILLLSIIIAAFATCQSLLRPWRGNIPNTLDIIINMLIIITMMCGAMTSNNLSGVQATVSAVAHVCIVVFLVALAIGVTIALIQRTRPNPYYHRFVCHHKAGAAAQARFLQLLLQVKTHQSCFIDSDHLTNLDDLFDVVRSKVGRLIVYMTSDVLKRPWCAGEVTTAYKARVKATRVMTRSFQSPSQESLTSPFTKYLDPLGKEFHEAGIIESDLSDALTWILSDSVPAVYIKDGHFIHGTHKLVHAAHELVKGAKGSPQHLPPAPSKPHSGAILLSNHGEDDEAVAVAGILSILLQEWVLNKTGQILCVLNDIPEVAEEQATTADLTHIVVNSKATIVVLTAGTLTSSQLTHIIIATQVMATSGSHEAISVCTPSFAYPAESFYRSTLRQVLPEGLDVDKAVESLQLFFKTISVRFTPSQSHHIIKTEASEIRARLHLGDVNKKDSHMIHSSTMITITAAVAGEPSPKERQSAQLGQEPVVREDSKEEHALGNNGHAVKEEQEKWLTIVSSSCPHSEGSEAERLAETEWDTDAPPDVIIWDREV